MRYTVSSDGVVIGETDLGFGRTGRPVRAGWFHPSAEGERRLPRLAPPLTLHRPDGSVVPTRSLGLEDVHALLALAEWEEAGREAPDWTPDDGEHDAPPCSAAIDDGADDGASLADDAPPDDDPPTPGDGWAPDEEPADLPRYRIVLELFDDAAIP